jgi:predicted ferric reductase
MVATRMRDTAFKRALGTLPLGAEVQIEGPFGNLILHNNAARAAVFLAGGIGITPFRLRRSARVTRRCSPKLTQAVSVAAGHHGQGSDR